MAVEVTEVVAEDEPVVDTVLLMDVDTVLLAVVVAVVTVLVAVDVAVELALLVALLVAVVAVLDTVELALVEAVLEAELLRLVVAVDVCVVLGDVNAHVFTKWRPFTRWATAWFSAATVVSQLSSRIRLPIMHLGLV